MKKLHGIDSMPETAENVAAEFKVARADQDAFALRSQQRYAAANAVKFFESELVPVSIPQKKGDPVLGAATSTRAKRPSRRWPS
jgi:acetyl-CoA acetyltransferase